MKKTIKYFALCICAIYFSFCENKKETPIQKPIATPLTEEEIAIKEMYEKYPNFMPGKFSLDTNKSKRSNIDIRGEGLYFYDIFRKISTTENFLDTLKYTLYYGSGRYGKVYSIVVVKHYNKTTAIPFDIERGEGIDVLSKEFTDLIKDIKPSRIFSKDGESAMLLSQILEETQGFKVLDITDTLMLEIHDKKNKNEKNKKNYKYKKTKAFLNFTKYFLSIKDSTFYFRGGDWDANKYIVYRDSDWQIFVLSVENGIAKLFYYNPLEIERFYI